METDYRTYNVASEKRRPGSIYSWYAELLKLRHDNAAFREGEYVPLDAGNENVFAFGRKTAAGEAALIVLNPSGTQQKVQITGWPGGWPGFRKLLLASPRAEAPGGSEFSVAPFGVVIAGMK